MSERISVLVVDDHTVVRKGLCSLLSAPKYGIDVVGEATNGQEAIKKARQLQPQVILMDLVMPELDGLQAIRTIGVENPEARILVLTSYAEDDLVLKAIDAGALGYLMKDASPEELVSTIHSVNLGHMSLPPDLARKVLLHSQQPPAGPLDNQLTAREMDVLGCVARGYSNKQIAVELSVSTSTVRTHVSNLLRKLGLENRTQLSIYAREHGLI